ncbi:MAG TPA: hypothetical protein PLV37_02565 [Bacillota bacterium]|jgi:hypothetical protein|nr:hypothetical protein [Bacillota bacterium]
MDKKGSLLIETAIILPLFLLAILSICILIRIIGTEENMMHSFAEEGKKIAKESYLTQLDIIPEGYEAQIAEGILHGTLLELRMVKRLEKEETLSLEDLRLNRFEYLYQDEGKPGTIDCSITYGIDLPLPLEFGRRGEFEQRLFFRGFIGAMDNEEGMGFDAMEKPDSASIVYVFPRAGKRFHKPDCRMIEVYPKEMILSSGVRNRYFPCKLCDAGSLPWGSRVYCFDKSGKVFHKGSCSTVDRYVIGIDRDEAIDKGYSPCSFCGGYNEQ